jgi:hypothetical protein
VDPLAPLDVQLANHLAFLSDSLNLSPSALRVRRAAVRTTLRQLGSSALTFTPIVSDVIKGAALRAARSPTRVPAWDLFLVLAFLRGPPFEPLETASWGDLSLKTFFLVCLASGRRVSEVHGLSGQASDVAFEANGSVSLRFLPEFIAKNQVPGDPSPVLFIKPLASILPPGDPDMVNCPVRAITVYLDRARSQRNCGLRRFFLPLNLARERDVAKPTLARWVMTLVRRAYKWGGQRKEGGGASCLFR